VNILLINHYAGTPALGMEYRPYYLAREWVRLGHRVMVIGSAYSHYRARQPEPGEHVVEGITYRWLPTPAYAGNGWGRMKNILSFLSQLWAQADALAREFAPDVVITSSTYPMDTWVGQRIVQAARQLRGAPAAAQASTSAAQGAGQAAAWPVLVHEVHDLWPLSPIELSGMSPWHPFALICQSAEDSAYRRSDVVVSMLPKVHAHMARRGLDLKKLHIVPNGISPEEWKAPHEPLRTDVEQAIDAARREGGVVVGYAGSMGEPNALDVLLDAAALLQPPGGTAPGAPGAVAAAKAPATKRPLHIVMVGDGHLREHLARRIAQQGLARVHLLPPIPKAQIQSFLGAIDIAYIGWQRQPLYRFGIAPNKLMDYMMAARAVLHAVEAGNDPVGEAGCGLTVPPEDPAAVAQGLRQLAALSPKERRVLGEKGRAYVLAHHTYPVLARRFLQAIERRA
jgi:glycosyltransferase involved in cell wall biosynthesis